jgi:hypothetical protein
LEVFPIKLGIRQEYLLLLLLFSVVLEFLAQAVRQENEIKVIQIRMEEFKLSLFSDDMILVLKRLDTLHQKSLRFDKHF